MSEVRGGTNMPNVILITTDQQRYDTLGCNGNSFIHTPNLDELAAQGARFELHQSRVYALPGIHHDGTAALTPWFL